MSQAGPPQSKSSVELIKDTLTIVAGLGAIAYVAGFVVSTLRLQSWGFASLWSLASTQYVGVGISFILFLVVTLVPSYWFIESNRRLWQTRQCSSALHILSSLVVLIVLPIILVGVLSTRPIWDETTFRSALFAVKYMLSTQWVGLLFWYGLIVGIAVCLSIIKSNKRGGPSIPWTSAIPNKPVCFGVAGILIMFAMRPYAVTVFPNINVSFGGGEWQDVRLVVDRSHVQLVADLAVPMKSERISKSVGLIGEDESVYFILLPNYNDPLYSREFPIYGRAVEIAKDGIKAIYWDPSEQD